MTKAGVPIYAKALTDDQCAAAYLVTNSEEMEKRAMNLTHVRVVKEVAHICVKVFKAGLYALVYQDFNLAETAKLAQILMSAVRIIHVPMCAITLLVPTRACVISTSNLEMMEELASGLKWK